MNPIAHKLPVPDLTAPAVVPCRIFCYGPPESCPVRKLIREYPQAINMFDLCKNRTPLAAACAAEHLKCVKYLLAKGAQPNVHFTNVESAMECAIGTGNLNIVEEVHKLNVITVYVDPWMQLSCMFTLRAMEQRSPRILEFLLRNGANVELPGRPYMFSSNDPANIPQPMLHGPGMLLEKAYEQHTHSMLQIIIVYGVTFHDRSGTFPEPTRPGLGRAAMNFLHVFSMCRSPGMFLTSIDCGLAIHEEGEDLFKKLLPMVDEEQRPRLLRFWCAARVHSSERSLASRCRAALLQREGRHYVKYLREHGMTFLDAGKVRPPLFNYHMFL